MTVLGIETSCDETAGAVVATTGEALRPWQIRSNIIASQAKIHREWGGVVPEIASRQHVRDICGVVERAMSDAEVGWNDVDALAVTQGPGLVGSLLVGVSFAKAVAASLGKPLVAVHHLAGHIESIFLEHGQSPLPSAVLVVSGGHTSLYFVPEPGVYSLIGRTRDDAAGEAYDKVAKLLGLGYPGGPPIDKMAREGNDQAVDFPRARLTHKDRNPPPPDLTTPFPPGVKHLAEFSFSGLKTAVVRYLQERGVPVAALIGAKEHAVKQVQAGVDLIVAQGTEAGGHCGEVTTLVLIPEVIEAVDGAVPVLAAGGIVNSVETSLLESTILRTRPLPQSAT